MSTKNLTPSDTTSNDTEITTENTITLVVTHEHANNRLDTYLSDNFKDHSRTFFQKLIHQNLVKINGAVVTKDGHKVKEHDQVEVTFPQLQPMQGLPIDKDLGVWVLFEHSDFLVVYKPAGLMVHAAATSAHELTLVDWLINHFKEIAEVGQVERPGIVHRLDKDTSGLVLVPRNNQAHMIFSDMFKHRGIEKNYIAVVEGHPLDSGTMEFPIIRDPAQGHRMTHKITYGRPSVTHYKVAKYLKDAALVDVHPVTGRTHQIRVHFSAIKHPIVGDKIYGKASELITRQALHAYSLSFIYKDRYYSFSCGLPQDMQELIKKLS